MYQFSFEKLKVWNESRALTKSIYTLTRSFPKEEQFCLINQIRRAIISVCSNIAEGSGRRSRKEQVHFYQISYSSLLETLNQLIIANDLGYIDDLALADIREKIRHISLMLSRLRSSQIPQTY